MRHLPARSPSIGKVSTSLLRRPLGLVSLLAVIGVAFAEVASKSARQTFSTYPASLSLLTGFVTLAVTASIVDQIVGNRASLRWEDVRGITLKGLNDEIRSARDILWIALFGRAPYNLPFEMSEQARRALERAGEAPSVWSDHVRDTARKQLHELLSDARWTPIGAAVVHRATQQIREGLVRWAPMTALARGDYHVLSPVAKVADAIEVLEFPLDADVLDEKGCVAARYRKAMCDLWCHTLTGCVYVEENIVEVLYPARHWPSTARGLLSPHEQDELKDWLVHPESFKRVTTNRQQDLKDLLPNW